MNSSNEFLAVRTAANSTIGYRSNSGASCLKFSMRLEAFCAHQYTSGCHGTKMSAVAVA